MLPGWLSGLCYVVAKVLLCGCQYILSRYYCIAKQFLNGCYY